MNELKKKEIGMYNIMGIVMVRGIGGSFPNRCLQKLDGRTILEWVLTVAKISKYLKKIIVATESDEIANEAKRLDIDIIRRPLSDTIDYPRDYREGKFRRLKPRSYIHARPFSISDSMDYVLWSLMQEEGYLPDLVVYISADNPFTTTKTYKRVIEKFFEDEEATQVITMYPVEPKFFTINITTGRIFPVFSDMHQLIDRQEYPPIYKGGSIQLIGLPKRSGSSGRKFAHIITDPIEGFCIHNERDLKLAECMVKAFGLKIGGDTIEIKN